MRDRPDERVERGRVRRGFYASSPGERHGAFSVMGPCGAELKIFSADGSDDITEGWEHVSVSIEHRIPNWLEMSAVKSWFWRDDECVVQFHPPTSAHVNNHSRCLHLWRNERFDFVTPPEILIGNKLLGTVA